jgi:hypothetical protein
LASGALTSTGSDSRTGAGSSATTLYTRLAVLDRGGGRRRGVFDVDVRPDATTVADDWEPTLADLEHGPLFTVEKQTSLSLRDGPPSARPAS